jgi:hypothetical protein
MLFTNESARAHALGDGLKSLGDLIRLALGFVACLWIVAHLFMLPRTAEGYRTWAGRLMPSAVGRADNSLG